VKQVLDLWRSPLLLERWQSVVRRTQICTTPRSMVLPGKTGPRHVHMGLAIFRLDRAMAREQPSLLEVERPLMSVGAQKVVIIDAPTASLPQLVAFLQDPGFAATIKIREPSFSLLSKPDNPRTQLKVVFEAHASELEILIKLSAMRGLPFGADAYYGLQGMVGADDTFTIWVGNAANVRHYWAVCSQLVALSAKRYLIQTTAEPEAWTAIMNAVLGRDAEDTIAKLKYKASVRGGRTIAVLAATTGALAAARRGGNRQITSADCVAEVSVAGEMGYEDQAVL